MSTTEKALSQPHSLTRIELSEAPSPTIADGSSRSPHDTHENHDLTVHWDGPHDPENPRNWSFKKKWGATIIVSAFTFITPVSSAMIAPASEQLAKRFDIHSTVLLATTTSIFILGYAFGPLFLGPLSELYGRSHVLQISNLWYLIWNLACGFARSKNELITFRFLAGLGGSAPLAIGGGVIGDLFDAEHRGQAIAIYSLAPLLGPVVGPLAGAWIAEKSTWHWVFWSTSIVDAAIQVLGVFFLKETYAPILLERRAAEIRKRMDEENASGVVIRASIHTADRQWTAIFSKALVRPFRLFVYEPIVQLLGFYLAFVYGQLYLFITTIPSTFQDVYHERIGIAGLHYLSLGVGLSCASQINAWAMDRLYAKLKARNGGVEKPEYRLLTVIPGSILLPAGLLITGWTAQNRAFWLVPDVGIALVGAGTVVIYQSIQAYVIDAFTLHAASALAAVAFLRSLAGFGFPLFAPTMYKALGYGKGDSILAAVAIGLGCPRAPWLLWFYGEQIRNTSRFARKSDR
ncbi:MFS general substrate transporter [Multifurca ochricompacta]|uniref:MFS general substrate transporter n=1 Tax=Multifurca ochricompacta TaxID=376703 RepID=A0AAD4M5F3_9AGAM|nr:MFS general substrate transporter [Multifurca ochricompacta]